MTPDVATELLAAAKEVLAVWYGPLTTAEAKAAERLEQAIQAAERSPAFNSAT